MLSLNLPFGQKLNAGEPQSFAKHLVEPSWS